MQIEGITTVVTGAASGLGKATAERLIASGAKVLLTDLPDSAGASVAEQLGENACFVAGDVCSEAEMRRVFDAALDFGTLRAVVHCAGRGGAVRLIEKDGSPGSLEMFSSVVQTNLIGSFNVLRLAALAINQAEVVEGERGVIVMTASIAAFEGQIGQIPYAASKAGVYGMTLVAARDLASKQIRVCTIAPGLFDTPLLSRVPDEVRQTLARSVPNPSRLGRPCEYALTATQIIENPMLNGETIRLDGALRMAPR